MRACQHFVDYVERVQADQWVLPTPCGARDIRTLVDHVVRWNTLVPEFIAGRALADMSAPFEREVLGDDPATAAASAARAAVAAFAMPGALQKIVRHPFGDAPGGHVVYLRLFDNSIHAWDLARALGIDDVIEPEIAELLYSVSLGQRDAIRASGHFGRAEIPAGLDGDTQARLLGLLGRKA